jgi:hypothetical protein
VLTQALQLEFMRKNNEFLGRLTFLASLDYLTRMEGADGKAMRDPCTRMVGA